MKRLLVLTLVVLAACATRPAQPAQPASCAGERVVVVSNSSNAAVDVFANASESAAPSLLGTVRAEGQEEFVLPRGSASAFTRDAKNELPPMATKKGTVDVHYVCR
jgi:hypothetical protein